jgi:hypothetical protein
MERVFYNMTDKEVMIQILSWVVHYQGKDPHDGTYCKKEMRNPIGILPQPTIHHYALLELKPRYIQPGEKTSINSGGALKQLYCIVESQNQLENRDCSRNVDSWVNQPFHFKWKLFGAVATYVSPGLSIKLSEKCIDGKVAYEISKSKQCDVPFSLNRISTIKL